MMNNKEFKKLLKKMQPKPIKKKKSEAEGWYYEPMNNKEFTELAIEVLSSVEN